MPSNTWYAIRAPSGEIFGRTMPSVVTNARSPWFWRSRILRVKEPGPRRAYTSVLPSRDTAGRESSPSASNSLRMLDNGLPVRVSNASSQSPPDCRILANANRAVGEFAAYTGVFSFADPEVSFSGSSLICQLREIRTCPRFWSLNRIRSPAQSVALGSCCATRLNDFAAPVATGVPPCAGTTYHSSS